MFELLPYERFRDTPSVRFFDVTVETSNARDLVIHTGPAVSPPNDPNTGAWQFYLHPHQEDNLLAASGGRTFFLRTSPGISPSTSFAWRVVATSSGFHLGRFTDPFPMTMARGAQPGRTGARRFSTE